MAGKNEQPTGDVLDRAYAEIAEEVADVAEVETDETEVSDAENDGAAGSTDGNTEEVETEDVEEETETPVDDKGKKPVLVGKAAKEAAISKIGKSIAKEYGWDLDDLTEQQDKILFQLANQEWALQQLKAGKTLAQVDALEIDDDTTTETDDSDLLSELMGLGVAEEVVEEKKDEKDDKKTSPPTAEKKDDATVVDWGFKDSEDWLDKVGEASKKGDKKAVATLYENLIGSQIAQIGPLLNDIVEERVQAGIKTALGEHLPVLQSSTETKKRAVAQETALSQIESFKPKGSNQPPPFANIRDLLKPDGQPQVVFNGKKVTSTPFTRVLKEHPYLLKIEEKGKDGKVDLVATHKSLFLAVRKLAKATPAQTKTLSQAVKDGEKIGERKAKQSAATGTGGKSKPVNVQHSKVDDGAAYMRELRENHNNRMGIKGS